MTIHAVADIRAVSERQTARRVQSQGGRRSLPEAPKRLFEELEEPISSH
jgi:hypothetical protein